MHLAPQLSSIILYVRAHLTTQILCATVEKSEICRTSTSVSRLANPTAASPLPLLLGYACELARQLLHPQRYRVASKVIAYTLSMMFTATLG